MRSILGVLTGLGALSVLASCDGDGGVGAAGYRVVTTSPMPRRGIEQAELTLAGDLAFVSTGSTGQLLSLADPASPTPVTVTGGLGGSWHALILGDDQLVAGTSSGLARFEISGTSLVPGAVFPLGEAVHYLVAVGDVFLIRDPGFGVHAIDQVTGVMRSGARLPISDGNPLRTMALGPDGILYIAGGAAGVQLVDTTDPDALRRVGALLEGRDQLGADEYVTDLAIADGRLIVLNNGIVLIYDLATPTAPVQLARSTNQGGFHHELGGRFAIAGDHALLIGGHMGYGTTSEITVIDLSADGLPVIGRVPLSRQVDAIAGDGTRVVVSGADAELLVVEGGS